jgi:predicted ArsR family transcriptional regulator
MSTKTRQKSVRTVRTRRALVRLLKQEGPLHAEALAAHLRISAMAVRQHLYALHDEQLVTYHEAPRWRGRPVKRWQLTPAADRLFPEAYAKLTLSLLTSITETFGKAGLERLSARRYTYRVTSRGGLGKSGEAQGGERMHERWYV